MHVLISSRHFFQVSLPVRFNLLNQAVHRLLQLCFHLFNFVVLRLLQIQLSLSDVISLLLALELQLLLLDSLGQRRDVPLDQLDLFDSGLLIELFLLLRLQHRDSLDDVLAAKALGLQLLNVKFDLLLFEAYRDLFHLEGLFESMRLVFQVDHCVLKAVKLVSVHLVFHLDVLKFLLFSPECRHFLKQNLVLGFYIFGSFLNFSSYGLGLPFLEPVHQRRQQSKINLAPFRLILLVAR